jgi:hypothetical protein
MASPGGEPIRNPETNDEKIFAEMVMSACNSVIQNKTDMIRFLDQHPNLDVNISLRNGNSPLGQAISKTRRKLAEKFLAAGARIDVKFNFVDRPNTPLLIAIQTDTSFTKHSPLFTRMLLENGADPEFAGNWVPSEFAHARRTSNERTSTQVVALLEEAIRKKSWAAAAGHAFSGSPPVQPPQHTEASSGVASENRPAKKQRTEATPSEDVRPPHPAQRDQSVQPSLPTHPLWASGLPPRQGLLAQGARAPLSNALVSTSGAGTEKSGMTLSSGKKTEPLNHTDTPINRLDILADLALREAGMLKK